MRLLIVTQYFPPEMGAPQARLYELAERLKNMGHEITVVTAMPNYPTGRIFKEYRGKLKTTEIMNGIRVIRTCLYPSKSSKTLPRLLSYISFGISVVLLGIWGLGRQDIVLIESPPLFLVPFALLVGKITRGKPVMMVSDIWPDIVIRMGHIDKKSLSAKIMLWLEKFSYNHSHTVALTNPGACEQIRHRFPKLKNVTVISNGVDTKMFSPLFRKEHIRTEFGVGKDDFLVGYCGLHGLAQGLEVIVGAADRLKEFDNIKFVMIGDGPTKNRLMLEADKKGLTNLKFYTNRPKKDMPFVLASLDISLVPLSARFPGTMPSKIYEALASGTPIIVAKGCEGENLVMEFNTGGCYEPGDSKNLADVLLELVGNTRLYKEMRDNCVALSRRFDRDVIAVRVEKILNAVLQQK
ncbi:MAG: glycosyltransferase family 4 protein [Sedimentisphaerales bacterium]